MVDSPEHVAGQAGAHADAAEAQEARPVGAAGSPETRGRILAAAREAFAEHGYVNATVEHIISRCGVSRGTFYYYFRNKEDVFETLARIGVDELRNQAQRRVQGGDAYARIEAGNRGYLRTWAEYRDVMRNLFEVAAIEPRFAELQGELRRPFIDRIQRSLEQQVRAGTIRPLDPHIVAFALAGMFDWFAYMWLGRGVIDVPDYDMEHVVKELTEIWYHAIYGGRTHEGEGGTSAG